MKWKMTQRLLIILSGERAQDYGEDLNNLEEDLENAESVYDLIPQLVMTLT